ncbi:hypothetical protein AN403_5467 [Pseudomonas fluorescens]|uniref:Uncharacterized protein n=1 Tax=Pseudomonas fluorescens TaxID=294 RepID=A0A0P8XLU5_PSEFL|nr:hypothetical protein AN403_5467 [Pseudomonas fluorescens]
MGTLSFRDFGGAYVNGSTQSVETLLYSCRQLPAVGYETHSCATGAPHLNEFFLQNALWFFCGPRPLPAMRQALMSVGDRYALFSGKLDTTTRGAHP